MKIFKHLRKAHKEAKDAKTQADKDLGDEIAKRNKIHAEENIDIVEMELDDINKHIQKRGNIEVDTDTKPKRYWNIKKHGDRNKKHRSRKTKAESTGTETKSTGPETKAGPDKTKAEGTGPDTKAKNTGTDTKQKTRVQKQKQKHRSRNKSRRQDKKKKQKQKQKRVKKKKKRNRLYRRTRDSKTKF